MFKSLEYVGFEGRPELRAVAEPLTTVLGDEIGKSRIDVDVTWTVPPNDSTRCLTLSVEWRLTNGVSGAASGTFTPDDLGEAWLTRSRCRAVWSDLLEDLSEKLGTHIQNELSEEPSDMVTERTATEEVVSL